MNKEEQYETVQLRDIVRSDEEAALMMLIARDVMSKTDRFKSVEEFFEFAIEEGAKFMRNMMNVKFDDNEKGAD